MARRAALSRRTHERSATRRRTREPCAARAAAARQRRAAPLQHSGGRHADHSGGAPDQDGGLDAARDDPVRALEPYQP
jgi:hypothetical protein